ncbi:hypothetical protein OsJ_32348 [Oryza sativa Japonica Group]|uniref:Uncharacterized protein n=1 Tax=Oryza sativa subsp. japonica TaxID=39947 RepID=B9G6U7_ORYSJ|nr:hypothetical protein OsJ_32348 [Oryza sativa Japonica Group]
MASSRLLSSRRLLPALLHTPSPVPIPRAAAAAAGELQSRRLWTYALTFGCAAGFVVTVLATFQDQLVFYLTPTDALARYATDRSKSRVRLGGLVLEGSVAHPSASSSEIEFVVTDLITDVLVRYEGALPDLFREGHSVVVEGFLKPFTDDLRRDTAGRKVSDKARDCECFFSATEVLAKHDEKYMPKEVGEALERNKKKLEEEAAAAAAASQESATAAVALDGAKSSS